ncbi:MAG: hypothetical protein U0S13_08310 [Mycobacterium sp.]
MTAAGAVRGRLAVRRFAEVSTATRLGLCAVAEAPEVRQQHVAAVLAWTPGMQHHGDRAVIKFDYAATAWWICEALDTADAEMVIAAGTCAVLTISHPQIVLGRFGFRAGRWMFRQSNDAALGIARGAVHAAGEFGRAGLRIECPSPAAMLTLVAVLRRLGVAARPAEGAPRVMISAPRVPAALEALGVPDAGEQYRRIRGPEVPERGRGHRS